MLGIRPIVDLPFKRVFGTPENKICLISLLNAILALKSPVVDVIIENPFNLQEFEGDKLSILHIRAVDQEGRHFNVEVQLTVNTFLTSRLAFYGCEVFAGQLKEGEPYSDLKPVYCICLLDGIFWKDDPELHRQFCLAEPSTGRILDEKLVIHTLQLDRYNLTEQELASATMLNKWLYWLLFAQDYEVETLLRMFPDEPIQRATLELAKMAAKAEDKAMYDSREKALRDYNSAMIEAERRGRMEGQEEGERRGLAEGERRGKLQGTITSLQEVLGIPQTDSETLHAMSLQELDALAIELREAVRNR